jgi:inosine-uridine nucleoside N-ribohydrolase
LASQQRNKIPVILDTDIGDDIDDTWALGLLLRCPELDVKLVIGDKGKPIYRAGLIAKFLQRVNHTDIPVGVGVDTGAENKGRQSAWLGDYQLDAYPGKVLRDGVQAIIDTIMTSPEPLTLIAIGPLPNVAAALEKEPRIAQRARFVGMHGSVRLGYGGSKTVSAEYNVRADAKACQKTLSAPWDVTITPLDTCGIVQLRGERYRRVRESKDPIASAIIENYRVWAKNPQQAETASSTLFDTVAVYLAFSEELLKMEELGIRVTDDGFTRIDPTAKKMSVATAWKDMDAFQDLMVQRLTGR